jgi:RNA polymerase sigma factor (sigma-70 family)
MRSLLDRLLARRRAGAGEGVPDAELLRRFTHDRDEAAFELLVWRYGGLVLGLCRRAVRDEQLAEDAFQAVFLVLARKAGGIRGNLGGWLFRVARRVSARAQNRRPNFQPLPEVGREPSPDPAEHTELSAILDAEVARLPERLRRPVVMCYLGGRSTEDAARELGCPRGTVLSRLATARTRLAQRLTRRGVTLPTALLTVAVSGRLVSSATTPALLFRVGSLQTGPALHLANGVLRTMNRMTLVTVACGVVLAATFASGLGWVAAQQQGTKTDTARTEERPTPQPPKSAEPPAQPPNPTPDPDAVRRAADEQLQKLEVYAETLRNQIDTAEKAILLQASSQPSDGALQKRLADAEAELQKEWREMSKMQAEADVILEMLKKPSETISINPSAIGERIRSDKDVRQRMLELKERQGALAKLKGDAGENEAVGSRAKELVAKAQKDLADAVREAQANAIGDLKEQELGVLHQRLNRLTVELKIKKAVCERLDSECSQAKQLANEHRKATANLQRLRKALEPQRDELERVNSALIQLRLERAGVPLSPAAKPDSPDAKLDAILREIGSLRREVQELKGQKR